MRNSNQRPSPIGRHVWRREGFDGQALVIFAFFSLVLVGGLALSVDVGMLLSERRQAQAAGDAAALAASGAARDKKSADEVMATGKSYAAFNANVPDSQVTVSRPPVSGAYAGDNNYIQVVVTKNVRRFFLNAVYSGPWSVTTSSVAGVEIEHQHLAMLGLNPDGAGIQTSGNSTLHIEDGGLYTNAEINASGTTLITADEYVTAVDGVDGPPNAVTTILATQGLHESGPVVENPLEDLIDPPVLPPFAINSVTVVNPSSTGCVNVSGGASISAGKRNSGGGSCATVHDVGSGQTTTFQTGNYRFTNGSGISLNGTNTGNINFAAGSVYNFAGGNGISMSGKVTNVTLGNGQYSFTSGAHLDFSGATPNGVLGGGTYYFNGGGGVVTCGGNTITVNPGTYIFDGGEGITLSGKDNMIFNAGEYTFWFNNADFNLLSKAKFTMNGAVHVKMYFYNGADLNISSNATIPLPSGEYFFNQGTFLNSNASLVTGTNVFFYFKGPNAYMRSSGSATFGFSAPNYSVYSGYYPNTLIYSDEANTSDFTYAGNPAVKTTGIVYIPSGQLTLVGNNSSGPSFHGQLIADNLDMSGTTNVTVEWADYVDIDIPMVYLVE